MLRDDRLHLGQFEHLASFRLSQTNRVAAAVAGTLDGMLDDVVDLVGRQQQSSGALPARLAAAFLPRGRLLRPLNVGV
jgi:hypothetical protein